MRTLSALLSLSLLVMSCGKTQAPASNDDQNISLVAEKPAKKTSTKAKPRASDTKADEKAAEKKILVNLDLVKVELKSPVVVESVGYVDGEKLPVITTNKVEADFVQMLRCDADYPFKTLSGQTLDSIRNLGDAKDQMRGAWTAAWNERFHCKVVGENIISGKFADIAAGSGEFYYVLNPCVTGARSPSRKNMCSYDLLVTNTISFESGFDENVQKKAAAVSSAEGELNGLLSDIAFYAEAFRLGLKACEDMIAHMRQLNAFRQGMLSLGFFIVGAVVGYVIGGPNMAIMIGQLAGQLGGQLVGTMALGWPMHIANTCLDPRNEDLNEFGVTKRQEQIRELLQTKIPEATEKLKAAMAEMQKANNKVATYNGLVHDATAKGIDLSDPATFANSAPLQSDALGGMLPFPTSADLGE